MQLAARGDTSQKAIPRRAAVSPSGGIRILPDRSAMQPPINPYANQSGISTCRSPLGAGFTIAPRSRPHSSLVFLLAVPLWAQDSLSLREAVRISLRENKAIAGTTAGARASEARIAQA